MHDGYGGLSRQLKTIARHVEKSREQIALEGIQETARRCEVQLSAVVRFAKHFGFSGWRTGWSWPMESSPLRSPV